MWAHWSVNASFFLQQLTEPCIAWLIMEILHMLKNVLISSIPKSHFLLKKQWKWLLQNANGAILSWAKLLWSGKLEWILHSTHLHLVMWKGSMVSQLLQEKRSSHSPESSHVDLSGLSCAIQIICSKKKLVVTWEDSAVKLLGDNSTARSKESNLFTPRSGVTVHNPMSRESICTSSDNNFWF